MRLLIILCAIGICACSTEKEKKLIKWEFDNYKKLTYSYTQYVTTGKSVFSGNNDMPNQTLAKGLLTITVKDQENADIVIKDLIMTMFRVDSLGDTVKFMSPQRMPEMFMQGLQENGDIEGGVNNQMQTLVHTFFPVMNTEASVGDSVDLKMMIPFNMYGSVLNVKGYNRVKLAESKNNIEKLTSVIDVTEYEIPEGVNAKYNCYMRGTTEYYFDSENQYFTNGESDFIMGFNSAINDESSNDFTRGMSMESSNRIILNLISVE